MPPIPEGTDFYFRLRNVKTGEFLARNVGPNRARKTIWNSVGAAKNAYNAEFGAYSYREEAKKFDEQSEWEIVKCRLDVIAVLTKSGEWIE